MKRDSILLTHGAGGKLTHDLVNGVFLRFFENEVLKRLEDSAVVPGATGRIAFTTDSYVVKPVFFPGGDIGRLAVCGTVNDLAMVGARPLGRSAAFIIEEGFAREDLERILASMRDAAREAGVEIITGDTKVVERGAAEGIYINTAGIGIVPEGVDIKSPGARPGDRVILSGPIGEHEIAVLVARGEFSLKGEVTSDCAPLNRLVERMLESGPGVHALRDPTRGGVATVLWEVARASGVGVESDEEKVPLTPEVSSACELLGFDPYYLANEGKLVAFCAPDRAEEIISRMKSDPYGDTAVAIGRVVAEHPGRVLLKTRIGGRRVLEPLSGEQFPRIC